MATVSTDAFLREVLPYCPDVLEIVAINAIRNAAIEFCRLSTIHRIDLTPISAVADQAEYTLGVPADTQLASVVDLTYAGFPLTPKSMEEIRAYFPGEDWATVEGWPRYYTQINPGTIQVVPYPTDAETDAIRGRIALMPTRDATTVYDDLYNRYVEAIALGARSRLHYTPSQPYTDPNMAERCKKLFDAEIAHARIRANKGQTRALTRVLFNRF